MVDAELYMVVMICVALIVLPTQVRISFFLFISIFSSNTQTNRAVIKWACVAVLGCPDSSIFLQNCRLLLLNSWVIMDSLRCIILRYSLCIFANLIEIYWLICSGILQDCLRIKEMNWFRDSLRSRKDSFKCFGNVECHEGFSRDLSRILYNIRYHFLFFCPLMIRISMSLPSFPIFLQL